MLRAAASLGLGLVFTLIAVAAYHALSKASPAAPPIAVYGPAALEIPSVGQPALLVPVAPELRADRYAEVSLELSGPAPGYRFAVVWQARHSTAPARVAVLARTSETRFDADLRQTQGWSGPVERVALIVEGPHGATAELQELQLAAAPLGTGGKLRNLFSDWVAFEGWQAYSINFVQGGAGDLAPAPVPAAVIWVAVSAVVFVVWTLVVGQAVAGLPLLLILMTGWVALDARWQVDLMRQLGQTYGQFGGLSAEGKRLADRDGDLYRVVQEFKQAAGDEYARVFVIGARDYSADTLRTKYHLLPHNADVFVPRLYRLRAGDFLFVLPGGDERLLFSGPAVPSASRDVAGEGVFVSARELDGQGSIPVTDADAPDGTARVQQDSMAPLMAGRLPDLPKPGMYLARFSLAPGAFDSEALVEVQVATGDEHPPLRFERWVRLPEPGYRSVDLSVVVPVDAESVAFGVLDATPGVRGGGFEWLPLVDAPTNPLLVSTRDERDREVDRHRLVEPVVRASAGAVFRVR